MPSLTTLLIIWGLAAPAVLYGAGDVQQKIAVHDTKVVTERETRKNERTICNGRVAELENAAKDASEETARLLAQAEAAAKVPEKGELKAICKGDRSCRDRGRL